MDDLRSYDLYTSLAQNNDSITSASHTATEALAVALSTALFYPLDSIITRLQVRYTQDSVPKHSDSTKRNVEGEIQNCLDTIRDVGGLAAEGLKDPNARKALYAGVCEAAGKEALEYLFFGAVYSMLSRRFLWLKMRGKTGLVHDISISLVSRALASMLTEPIATIVVRRQVGGSGRMSALDDVMREKGVKGLWSGYWATLILSTKSSIMALAVSLLRGCLARARGHAGDGKEGAVSIGFTRAVAESVLYRVSVMQACARAGGSVHANTRGKGSLMLEVSRGLLSQGVTVVTHDLLTAVMLRLSTLLLYVLEPFLLSEEAITESMRDSAGTDAGAANQQLLDDAKYINRAAKGAIDIVNRGVGLATHGKDNHGVTDAVAELVGDYVEDAPEEGYLWFRERDGRH
ncbi:putative acylglycerol lipase [Microsporum audouinii]